MKQSSKLLIREYPFLKDGGKLPLNFQFIFVFDRSKMSRLRDIPKNLSGALYQTDHFEAPLGHYKPLSKIFPSLNTFRDA